MEELNEHSTSQPSPICPPCSVLLTGLFSFCSRPQSRQRHRHPNVLRDGRPSARSREARRQQYAPIECELRTEEGAERTELLVVGGKRDECPRVSLLHDASCRQSKD